MAALRQNSNSVGSCFCLTIRRVTASSAVSLHPGTQVATHQYMPPIGDNVECHERHARIFSCFLRIFPFGVLRFGCFDTEHVSLQSRIFGVVRVTSYGQLPWMLSSHQVSIISVRRTEPVLCRSAVVLETASTHLRMFVNQNPCRRRETVTRC